MYVTLYWMVERGERKVLSHPEVLIIRNSLLDIINSMRVSTLKNVNAEAIYDIQLHDMPADCATECVLKYTIINSIRC